MVREAGWWMSVTPSLPLTKATVEVEGLPIYYRTGGSGATRAPPSGDRPASRRRKGADHNRA